jgi:hypothetical protein
MKMYISEADTRINRINPDGGKIFIPFDNSVTYNVATSVRWNLNSNMVQKYFGIFGSLIEGMKNSMNQK